MQISMFSIHRRAYSGVEQFSEMLFIGKIIDDNFYVNEKKHPAELVD